MPLYPTRLPIIRILTGLTSRAILRWATFLLAVGMVLSSNVSRVARADAYIFWIDNFTNNSIFRSDLDGTNVVEIVPNAQGTHIAIDPFGEKVYWSVGDYLRRCNFDGTSAEVFRHDIGTARSFQGLAFDDTQPGTLYYTLADGTLGEVSRISTDGTGYQSLLGGGHWFDIALYPAYDMMLLSTRFISGSDPRIFRADKDGAWLAPNVFPTSGSHARIAVHSDDGLLFWTGPGPNGADSTWRSNLDGTDAEVVLGRVEDLQVFGDKLYYAQLGAPSRTDIWRSNLDGTSPELVTQGEGNITAFAIIPEPSTLSLLSLATLLAIVRERNANS